MTEKIGRIEKSPVVVGPRKPGQAQPANGWFGTAPKKKAFDSAKRARLHRALDAILDARPVRDDESRKDSPHGFKPTPNDDFICRVCGKSAMHPLHYKPVKVFTGKRDAGYSSAKDSSKRARMHRALDAVLDARAK